MSSANHKVLALTLASILVLTALSGCGKKAVTNTSGTSTTTSAATSTASKAASGTTTGAAKSSSATTTTGGMGSGQGFTQAGSTKASVAAKALATKISQGRQLVKSRCTAGCHDVSTVTSARKSMVEWSKTVDGMVKKGAKLSASERAAVIEYLSSL